MRYTAYSFVMPRFGFQIQRAAETALAQCVASPFPAGVLVLPIAP
jgi:hypothetical protein